jgi:hypothetical protein
VLAAPGSLSERSAKGESDLEHFDHGQKDDSHDSSNSHAPDVTQSTSTRSVERWLMIPMAQPVAAPGTIRQWVPGNS